MLGLVLELEILILRETLKSNEEKLAEETVYGEEQKEYEFFSITELKECLKQEVIFEEGTPSPDQIKDDFVVIMMFAGNDFIP